MRDYGSGRAAHKQRHVNPASLGHLDFHDVRVSVLRQSPVVQFAWCWEDQLNPGKQKRQSTILGTTKASVISPKLVCISLYNDSVPWSK